MLANIATLAGAGTGTRDGGADTFGGATADAAEDRPTLAKVATLPGDSPDTLDHPTTGLATGSDDATGSTGSDDATAPPPPHADSSARCIAPASAKRPDASDDNATPATSHTLEGTSPRPDDNACKHDPPRPRVDTRSHGVFFPRSGNA